MIKAALQFLEKTLDTGLSIFPSTFGWIKYASPGFSLHGDQITILHKPEEFYDTLLERCRNAKFRIMLASLYIGTGPMEEKLIQTINERVNDLGHMKVNILLDANRGSRGKINSRKMLLPLLIHSKQCQVSMFHTPTLRGPLKFLLPARYNELVGLQHMKLYLFDDDVLISGANLSEDYFTKRQDRYMLVKNCKELADFYWELVNRISSVSLGLDHSDNLFPRSYHPYKFSRKTYIKAAKDKIWGFYKKSIKNSSYKTLGNLDHDSWVFPLLELPPLSVHQDSKVTQRLLEGAEQGCSLTLSTGYFNLTDQYVDTILQKTTARFRILMAHPKANGFLKAGGLASGIPGAYTGLALEFLTRVISTGQDERVTMFEYIRNGWTYHAKGLWYTLPNNDLPSLTLIGSSNFGSRSVRRDLETQIALITTNESLRLRLKEEEDRLNKHTVQFTPEVGTDPDRKPALWILTTMRLFKTFF
ncbi:phosphatidylglycerophosphate synthase 1 [Rhodnius prolixus]|uniref:phosphatidylglycerophosphate synthase 1 n=1 Tax=Rhodnius prolixus TaxID=13249 RepID=UPI003D18CB67